MTEPQYTKNGKIAQLQMWVQVVGWTSTSKDKIIGHFFEQEWQGQEEELM